VRRLATFRWRTPAPTFVDEELALFDDDTAWLVVRGSRTLAPSVGTYRCTPASADRHALVAAGPGPHEFDLLNASSDAATAALTAVADRVAAAARETPNAVATFHARPLGAPVDGSLAVSLLVVASGDRAVEFEIDPAASSVQFSHGGQPVGWCDIPDLPTGFVMPDAAGLGGVRRRAHVEPGAHGAIAFDVRASAGASAVSMRIVGWLPEALPDDALPARFSVQTEETPIETA
jgi:hypothetical protein